MAIEATPQDVHTEQGRLSDAEGTLAKEKAAYADADLG